MTAALVIPTADLAWSWGAVFIHSVHYGLLAFGFVGVGYLLLQAPRPAAAYRPVADRALVVAHLPASAPRAEDDLPGRAAAEASGHRRSTQAAILPVVVVSSLAAAGLHGAVAPAHAAEGVTVFSFFLVLALAQAGWAGLVALRGLSDGATAAGAAINLGAVAVWAVSRTVGVWMVEGGAPEPVGVVDGAVVVWELVVVAACAAAWQRGGSEGGDGALPTWADWSPSARSWAIVSVVLVAGVLLATGG